MPEQLTLIGAGAILIVVALIGGGLSAAGIEFPVIKSKSVRTLLALIGFGLAGIGVYQLTKAPASVTAANPPGSQSTTVTNGGDAGADGGSQAATVTGGENNQVNQTDCKSTGDNSPNVCGSKVEGDVNIGGVGK